MPLSHSTAAPPDDASDLFLHIVGRGAIRGEARTEGHVDDIELTAWQWGVAAGTAIGSGVATARRAYRRLVVTKRIDSATTPLFASLVNNVELSECTLTMRKAGGSALDYFRIALGRARVVDIAMDVDGAGRPVERVSFSFTRVTVAYTPQQAGGAGGAASEFEDEVLPG